MKHWQVTPYPTLEITTNIAEKGCVVDCAFCPQRTLEKSYDGERILSLENYRMVIDKLPKEIRITFAGFTEPFLNKHCAKMILYAHEQGHPVSVFTTGVGMKPEDIHLIKDIPFFGYPNGGFCLHLPDSERIAKHPINKNFLAVMKLFSEVQHEIQNFHTMCMGLTIHPEVEKFFAHSEVPNFWNRAGNLSREAIIKPELLKVYNRVLHAPIKDGPHTCGCAEKLYHNVLLPNGNVSLCCMDYALTNILGNLFSQSYERVIPRDQSCFDICRRCENGVKPQ